MDAPPPLQRVTKSAFSTEDASAGIDCVAIPRLLVLMMRSISMPSTPAPPGIRLTAVVLAVDEKGEIRRWLGGRGDAYLHGFA